MREGSFFDILTLVLGVDLVGGCLLGRGLFNFLKKYYMRS